MAGRPTKLTPEVRKKMEEVAAIDGTVEEMAYYCDVTRQTIWDWLQKDKALSDRIDQLRARPILKARQAVVKSLDDHNSAYRYLERKARKEFTPGLDVTTDGKELPRPILDLHVQQDDSDNKDNPTE